MNSEISNSQISIGRYKIDLGLLITLLLSSFYIAIHFYICVFRYNTFQYRDWDFSLYANIMWNLVHGSTHFSIMSRHFLGNHFTPIAFVVTPIYFIFRSPLTLLFLQTLSLALVSVPVYLLAKRKFDWRIAIGFVLLYFLYPPLLYVTLYEFHFEAFAPLFLAFAFYFLITNKKILLFIMAALAMMCKENVPAVVAAMGFYALLFRPRRRLLGLVLFCVGAAYFLLITLYLQKLFAPGGGEAYAGLYAKYGKGFANVFLYMLTHPVTIIKDLFSTQLRREFFEHTFSPFLYLPLLRPDILIITAPTILKNLLSKNPLTHTIFWHYTTTIIPFVLFSTIFALKKLTFFDWVKRNLVYILVGLIIVEAVQGFLFWPKRHEMVRFHLTETSEDKAKKEASKLIPENAPVIATFDFLPQLSQRENIYTFYMLWKGWATYEQQVPPKYAIIDFNDHFINRDILFIPEKTCSTLQNYTTSDTWGVLFARGDIVLFEKDYISDKRIITILNEEKVSLPEEPYLALDDSIELADIDLDDKIVDDLMHITFYWRLKKPSSDLYQLLFFASDGKRDRLFGKHYLGYAFYTPSLSENKILKEDYWLPLPDKLKRHKYVFTAGFFNLTTRKKARVESSSMIKLDTQGKFILIYYDNR
jgi:uncharacterized membrane protein